MKNTLIIFTLLMLVTSVFAAGQGNGQPGNATRVVGMGQNMTNSENQTGQESGEGEQVANEQQTQNQAEIQQITIQNQEQTRARNMTNASDIGNQNNNEWVGPQETKIQENQQMMIQTQQQTHEGKISIIKTYQDEKGNNMQINITDNETKIRAQNIEVNSSLVIIPKQEQNRVALHTNLSNGRNAEIKVMPITASQTAITHLQMNYCNESNGCVIQIKEVGEGNQTRAAYQIQAVKRAKLIGLFDVVMPVEAQVSAENGELLRIEKPWWAIFAFEQND